MDSAGTLAAARRTVRMLLQDECTIFCEIVLGKIHGILDPLVLAKDAAGGRLPEKQVIGEVVAEGVERNADAVAQEGTLDRTGQLPDDAMASAEGAGLQDDNTDKEVDPPKEDSSGMAQGANAEATTEGGAKGQSQSKAPQQPGLLAQPQQERPGQMHS